MSRPPRGAEDALDAGDAAVHVEVGEEVAEGGVGVLLGVAGLGGVAAGGRQVGDDAVEDREVGVGVGALEVAVIAGARGVAGEAAGEVDAEPLELRIAVAAVVAADEVDRAADAGVAFEPGPRALDAGGELGVARAQGGVLGGPVGLADEAAQRPEVGHDVRAPVGGRAGQAAGVGEQVADGDVAPADVHAGVAAGARAAGGDVIDGDRTAAGAGERGEQRRREQLQRGVGEPGMRWRRDHVRKATFLDARGDQPAGHGGGQELGDAAEAQGGVGLDERGVGLQRVDAGHGAVVATGQVGGGRADHAPEAALVDATAAQRHAQHARADAARLDELAHGDVELGERGRGVAGHRDLGAQSDSAQASPYSTGCGSASTWSS
ncbi:hypothetical protein [Nannocystis pusilla]|uniref:hypothetical protein n=1 Tax=Nannocystis pusilla TaxID=889268 RepID=UPI003B77564C